MIGTLEYRGPDGFGFHLDGPVGLAHARLAIIDLSTGDQPVHNEVQDIWVVFNGEIFNYKELRAQLQGLGHRFYTQSDTEVIVHLYEEHGDRFVEHLNGQFAIALWDQRRSRLVLARDRVGIRPIYYARAEGRLWFGSEVKALLAVVPKLRCLNLRGIAEAFSLWAPIDPDTVFEGVQTVPPGYILTVEASGREMLTKYWDWDFPEQPATTKRSIDDVAAELRELLIDAVRLQLRADVPVGAYLSGGLDSSGLVSLIRTFSSAPLRTFSVTFEDAEFDESEHQQEMVAFLGTDHTTLRCTRSDIASAFPELIRHTEAPVLRTAPTPLMLLSAKVREHGFKVVLSGEGADEVFGGYDLFKEAKVRRFWAKQPDSRIRPMLLQRLYPYLKNSPAQAAAFSREFFRQGMSDVSDPFFAHMPRWRTSRKALGFLSAEARASLGNFDPIEHLRGQLPGTSGRWSNLARDQYVEAKTLLAGYLLSSQGDRVAMANSVEGRVPYLDHRVIEFAAQLPPHYKIRALREKHVLRQALAGLLPERVVNRVKQPYRAPDSQCFFRDGKAVDYVEELLSPSRLAQAGYFDREAVGKLVQKCRGGRATGFADNQAFVGVLSTMLLDNWFVRGERA